IGAGPSGYYAAGALIAQKDVNVSVDIFDRLPTPFGLVRYGVAPDHDKIKSVIRVYEKISSDPRVRFFGNVAFGADLLHDDVRQHFDQIIYAYGSSSDRKLGIPGEELRGAYSATEFVGWYNSHPDYVDLSFDVATAQNAVVVGNGNVAMDVVRMLATPAAELATTDIADHALTVLRQSAIQKIYMLGRRGPAQAAFTNPELRELGVLADADVIVSAADLDLDPASLAAAQSDKSIAQNVETLRQYARRAPAGRPRQIILRFLTSPVELTGVNGHVAALKIERNELRPNADGTLAARGTSVYETLPVDIIFRAIGYKGLPMPGVPYDTRSGTIPNQQGRVMDPQTKQILPGEYVVGWAKRGPTGVIGTNKADAAETVKLLLHDVPTITPVADVAADPQAFVNFLRRQQPSYVTYADWQRLDRIEVERGKPQGRPRVKFAQVEEMLDAVRDGKT
ncbi:MAG: FAD-dependent oxidoreductase, partial [Chloroflexota bacterium]